MVYCILRKLMNGKGFWEVPKKGNRGIGGPVTRNQVVLV